MIFDNLGLAQSKILIVDDNRANLDLLSEVFEMDDYALFFATSGEQAIKIAEFEQIDLILLDVVMPEMDGFEICERLKIGDKTCDIPVIFVTAKSEVNDIVKGFEIGAVDYVCKPVQRAEVCARVRTQLQLRSVFRTLESRRQYTDDIINRVGDSIVILREDAIITSVNPATIDSFGYTNKEMIDKRFTELFVEPDQDIIREQFILTVEGEGQNQTLDVRGERKDGSVVNIDLNISRINAAENPMVCLMHDTSFHKQTENELRRLSGVDPLTNIANRRRFNHAFENDWRVAKRQQTPLAALLVDIDFFKLYNDHYGHIQGDHCLVGVANALTLHGCRPGDMVARYGGEEFVVILPQTDSEGALQVANDMIAEVEQSRFVHVGSAVSDYVTISIGVAVTIPEFQERPQRLLENADKALYQAKETGRNRCCLFVPKKFQ
jgi:diguanylate cyclase (GGDEF)-like protein/PAS domain S-box-containing protein